MDVSVREHDEKARANRAFSFDVLPSPHIRRPFARQSACSRLLTRLSRHIARKGAWILR
jgi:hypothetical protein